jgi:hypothetical protein
MTFRANFYSSSQQYDVIKFNAFDEGPLVVKNYVGINSSSISTKLIDQFRQGIEITQEKYAVNGMVKIYAGTPGHIINPEPYGINKLNIVSENSYIEIDYFNPISYIKAQEPGKKIEDIITFPIIVSDCNQQENYILNGIIEPLTIRAVISFFSIEFPFESHGVKGSLMGGNLDSRFASSEQVLTVNKSPDFNNEKYYLDAFEVTSTEFGIPMQSIGYISEKYSHTTPYDDNTSYLRSLGIANKTHGEDMVIAINAMNSSTENYVPPGKKSSSTGFFYDNMSLAGTDSIAFGGLTY